MTQAIVGTVFESQGSIGTAQIPVGQQMDAFLSKLDADVAQSRRMLATAEAHLVEKKALCAAFPSTLPVAPYNIAITPGAHKAEAELFFEVTTREEVLQLLDAFPGVPVVMWQAGCTSFIAEERSTEADAGAKAVPIGEVIYRLAHWVDAPQEEYTWWTHLAGKLVHVLAKTKKGHAVCSTATSSIKSLTPTVHEVTYNYGNLPDGVVTKWHGGSLQTMVPVTVHQPRGSSFRDAVAKPMSASAKVNARNCDC